MTSLSSLRASAVALPLIALPGTSPRKREKEAGAGEDAHSATLAIGETLGASRPLPVYGERMPAGR